MKKYLLPIVLLLAAAACSKTQDKINTDPVTDLKLVPTDNALRFGVEFTHNGTGTPVVEIRKKGEDKWTAMPGTTALLLYPETGYECRVCTDEFCTEPVSFETGALPENLPSFNMTENAGGPDAGYIVQQSENVPGAIIVSDVYGKVVWYQLFDDSIKNAHYSRENRCFSYIYGDKGFSDSQKTTPAPGTKIEVMDLDGKVTKSIAATENTVLYPHHEITMLPSGNILTLDHESRVFDLTSAGREENTTVWADVLREIDTDGKTVWSWNVFDHIQMPDFFITLKAYRPKMGLARDLVHANSLAKDSEGNYYVSFYYPEEIWKIDGKTGEVIYKYGPHGDVTLEGGFPVGGYHTILLFEPDKFMVLKNPRSAQLDTQPMLAQLIQVNPATKVATMLMNVSSTISGSSTKSSAQLLPDGATILFNSTQGKEFVFTDAQGTTLRSFTRSFTCHRTFWFESLW